MNGFSVRPCMCVSTHALGKGRPTACLVVTGDLRALCSLERMGRGSQPTKSHTHCVRLKLPPPLTPPSPKLLLSQQVCVCVRPRPPPRPLARAPLPTGQGERGHSLPSFARLVPLPVPQCVFDTSRQRGAAGQRITRVLSASPPQLGGRLFLSHKLLTLFFASSEISKHPLPSPSKKQIEIDVQFGSFFFKSYFGFTTKRYKIQVYNQTVPNPGLPPNSTTKP